MAAPRRPEPADRVTAWRPDVPGIAEVLHARFVRHAYPVLRDRLDTLHRALTDPDGALHAQSRFAFVAERLAGHLGGRPVAPAAPGPTLADRLRQLLDTRVRSGMTLDEAARVLHAHPTHLVRAFSREFGIPPHRYLDGRRVDLARRLLLDGASPADAAQAAGFYDQAHLTRRFARTLGVTPGRYAAGGRSAGGPAGGSATSGDRSGTSAAGRSTGKVIGGAEPSESRTRRRART
ncbi:helix-turn-helix domain-containing protein [Pseudonocardia sediminis]